MQRAREAVSRDRPGDAEAPKGEKSSGGTGGGEQSAKAVSAQAAEGDGKGLFFVDLVVLGLILKERSHDEESVSVGPHSNEFCFPGLCAKIA